MTHPAHRIVTQSVAGVEKAISKREGPPEPGSARRARSGEAGDARRLGRRTRTSNWADHLVGCVSSRALEAARWASDSAFSAMQQVVDTVIGTIRGLISGLLQFLQGDFQGGVSTVIESVKGFFSGMASAVGTALSGLKTAVETGIRNVVSVFQPIIDKIAELTGIDLYETGKALLEGLQKGIRDAVGVVRGALDWLASHLPQWVRTALGMSSPSRVFMAIGRDVVRGLAVGIEDAAPVALAAVTDLARRASQTAASSLSLMDYIRTAGWGSGGLGGNALAAWMRSQGFDEETIESYRDLHSMREGGHWKTREAFMLWKRRVMPRGGDWTGAGREPETEGWQATQREWAGFTAAMRSFEIPPLGFGAGSVPIGGRGSTGPIVGIPGPGKGGGSAPMGGPVDVKLAGGKLEGDMRVKEPIVVRVTIGSREIDAIATEVVRKISGTLLAKPLAGTP